MTSSAAERKPVVAVVALRQTAAKGALLVVVLKGLGVAVGRISQLIMPLFLLPSDFGIFALASFFFGVMTLVADLGMSADLVRRRDGFEEAADGAFLVRFTISSALVVGSFGVGWASATIFGEPRLSLPIVVLSTGLLLQALSMVPRAIASRALDFRRAVIPDQSGKFAASFVTIGLAIAGFAFWSPVYGTLVGLAIGTAAQITASRWRPRLRFNGPLVMEVVRFGQFVMLTSLANFVAHSVDNAVVGFFLGVTPLGFYALAYSWGVYFTSNLSAVVATVGYPVFSHVADSPARLKRVFLENIRFYGYLAVCLSLGVLVLAPLLVSSLYDPSWLPSVVPMQILAVAGLLLGYGGVTGDALNAKGSPRTVFKYAWAEAGILLIILTPATLLGGLVGTSLAALVGAGFFATGLINSARRLLGVTLGEWLQVTRQPLVAGGVAVLAGVALRAWLPPSLPSLVIATLGFIAAYFISLQFTSGGRFWQDVRHMFTLAVRS